MSRSPNYPALGLGRSLAALQKLWDTEKRSSFSQETAAQSLGFKSLSGPARTAIAALRQYGLLETSDKDQARISQLGIAIVAHEDGSPERKAALRDAGRNPKLFKELLETHVDASDANIRAYLITKKEFSEEGAKKVIKSFRDTVRFAGLDETALSSHDEDDILDDGEANGEDESDSHDEGKGKADPAKIKPPPLEKGVMYSINLELLEDGRMKVVTSPGAVTVPILKLLTDVFELKQKYEQNAVGVENPYDEYDDDAKIHFAEKEREANSSN